MCVKIYIHVDIFSLSEYFAGTDFQQRVWNVLLNIPHGKTFSYAAFTIYS